jgi:toxin-antitoxin system PIN domain toxin
MLGFIRIMTHPGIQARPMRVTDCVQRVRSWIEHPRTEILAPGEHHAEILFRFLVQLGAGGNLTTDAHLAALAVEYQAELVSTDADFARFQGLRWFNPMPR